MEQPGYLIAIEVIGGIAALFAIIAGLAKFSRWLRPQPPVASEGTLRQIDTKLGRIVEYFDGLPEAPPEIRDPFKQGIAHKEKYEYAEAISMFRQALVEGPTGSQRTALLGLIGICFYEQAELEEAEGHYREAEAAAIEAGDQKALATIYNNIGQIHKARGDYDQALEWHHKSLKIDEDIGDRAGLATAYNNIGHIHHSRGGYDQALDWYEKSLKIREEIGDRAGLATSYNNIGGVYDLRGQYDQALEWYQKSIKIKEDIGDRPGLATTYNNIGCIYHSRGELNQALDWLHESLKIREEIGDRAALATIYNNIGLLHKDRGDYGQALDYVQQALTIFEQIGAKDSARRVKGNIEILKGKEQKRPKK